ncbi:DNA-directed RNA polymerase subunit D [Candidatus Woesearchaeota archaeon]|nr:DNA-directed RNA polymerase subunit D [Candidatus Woesearchaeota archaeon]
MKLELIEWNKKHNKMHLTVHGANDSFINLIRRFSIEEVPTLAVEDVEVRDNSSALYDEIVAHRIGLMPIKTDLKSYNTKENCACKGEGCAKCELKITLKASKKGIITASEAKSQDPKCTFVYDDMPIVKLAPKQKIELEATAVLGRGKDHAKWAPGLVFYRKEASIETNDIKMNESQKERIRSVCGEMVSITGSKVKVEKEKLSASSSFDACCAVLEEVGATVTDTDNHILTVESWGQLNCKEILEHAAEIIIQKVDALEEQIK